MKSLAQRRKICNALGDLHYARDDRRENRLRAAVRERLPGGGVLLDAGCGPWLGLTRLYVERAGLCVGMDVEDLNPEMLSTGARGVMGDLRALPFRPGSIDVVAMRSVVEHLARPEEVFHDLCGILKPGGWIVAIAPSRWYYASLAGRIIPDAMGHRILEFIFGPTVHDNFPVYYRANTPRAVRRVARAAGLDLVEAIVCPHPPDYLKFSPVLFRLGVLYDRMAGLTKLGHVLQASFLYLLRKP